MMSSGLSGGFLGVRMYVEFQLSYLLITMHQYPLFRCILENRMGKPVSSARAIC